MWVGRVEFPTEVNLLAVSSNRALVVETDEWDVQAVAVYGIEKGG